MKKNTKYNILQTFVFLIFLFVSLTGKAQTTIFRERFDVGPNTEANGATTGLSEEGIAWSATCPVCYISNPPPPTGRHFDVESGEFENKANEGVGIWITTGAIDVSTATKLMLTVDYHSNLPWAGGGNMESNSECGTCAGDPDDHPNTGLCGSCWDFINVQLILDGTTVYNETVGNGNNVQTYQFSFTSACFAPGTYTNAVIRIRTQAWSLADPEIIRFDDVHLSAYQAPTITLTPVGPYCVNDNNPKALTATPSGGVWSGQGVVGNTFTPSAAGAGTDTLTYTYQTAATGNCPVIKTMQVVVNPAPTPSITGNLNFCQGGSTTLDAGSGYSMYSWSTGDNGQTTTVSTSGMYSVTVTNSNGCSGVASVNVTVDPAPPATAGVNPTTICTGDDFQLTSTGGVSYQWSGPNGFTSNIQNPTITNAMAVNAGIYTVTVTGANTCSATATVNVIINALPVATASASPNPICEGQTLTLTSTGGTSYSWSGPGGFVSSMQNPVINNVTTGHSGTYTVTVTGAGGCNSTATVNVTVNTLPVATAGASPNPVCEGQTLTLTSSGGTSYSWSGPGGFTSGVQNPVINNVTTGHSGTYNVTVTNAAGCYSIASVTITVNPQPVVTIVPVPALCTTDPPYTPTGNPPGGTWTFNGTPVSNIDPSIYAPGNYTLTYNYTGANGCSNTQNITVTIQNCGCPNQPDVDAGQDASICEGNTFTLNGVLTNTITCTWTTSGDGSFSNPNIPNPVYTPGPGDIGLGTVTLTITTPDPDGNGPCSGDTDNMILTINATPVLNFPGGVSICENTCETLTLSVTGGSGSYTANLVITSPITYTIPAFVINGTATFTICYQGTVPSYNSTNNTLQIPPSLVPSGTNVTFSLNQLIDNNTNCVGVLSGSSNTSITVYKNPTVSVNPVGPLCSNDAPIVLTGTPSGGFWSGTGVNNGTFDPAISGPGFFQLTYTYTDGNGCSGSATTTVQVNNCNCNLGIIVNAGADVSACDNDPVQLQGSVTNASNYFWTTSGDGAFSDINDLNATYTPGTADATNGSVTITLTVPDPDGPGPCTDITDQTIITFIVTNVSISPVPDQCEGGSSVTLTGLPAGGTFTGNGVNGNNFDPAVAGPGDHLITYNAVDNGCPGQAQTIIHVQAAPVIAISPVSPLCDTDQPVNLSATPSGGVFSGTGVNGNTFDPGSAAIGSNVITYTYQDIAGCKWTQTLSITVNNCGCANPASADAGGDIVSCNGSPATIYGNANYSATWTTSGTGIFDFPQMDTVNYLPSPDDINGGSVTLTLTTIDPDGAGPCLPATSSMTLTFNIINIQMSLITQVCETSDKVVLTAVPTGGTWTGTGVNGNEFDPVVAGIGTFTLTYTVTENGCTASKNVNVTVTAAPVVTLSSFTDLCLNDPAIVLSGGSPAGGQYFINGDMSNPVSTFSPTMIGTYTITYVAGPINCKGSASTTITVNDCGCVDPVSVSVGSDQTICSNQTAHVIATLNKSIGGNWSTSGDGTFTTPSALQTDYTPGPNDITLGTATLTFTSNDPDGNGPCSAATASMHVSIIKVPDITIIPVQELCLDDLPVSLQATPAGGVWTGNGLTGNQFDPGKAGPGKHTLTYTVGTQPCTATKAITITVKDCGCTVTIDINAGKDTTVCQPGIIKLNGSLSGVSNGTWTTSGSGTFNDVNLISPVYTPSLNDINNGSVTLTFTSEDPDDVGPCQPVSDDVLITIEKIPDVLLLITQPTCINPKGSVKITVISGQNLQYSIDNGVTFTTKQTIDDLNPGQYQLIVKNPSVKCQTNLDFTINPFTEPLGVWKSISAACSNQPLNSFILESADELTLPFQAVVNGIQYPVITSLPYLFDGLQTGAYHVVLTDKNGCKMTKDFLFDPGSSIKVSVDPVIVVDKGGSAEINLSISGNYNSITWNPSTYLSCADCTNPIVSPLENTEYTVLIQDENGCHDEASVFVRIRKQVNVFIPNAISPNHDGINDEFTVYTDDEVVLVRSMRIFDRWGGLVFSRENFTPNDPKLGWNGRFKEQELNPAVFIYYIELELKDGKTKLYKGDFTLIR